MASVHINLTSVPADNTKPYNYQEWRARNIDISPNESFVRYDNYLKVWYKARDIAHTTAVDVIELRYVLFLKTLGLSPRTTAEQTFFANVDSSNFLSIQATITGYARKLKDVAIYIASRRHQLRHNKLKNNITGTIQSLERLFYTYILNAFTRKALTTTIDTSQIITDPAVYEALPYLADVSGEFNIEIVEVYDTNNYFDRDPAVDISNYTTVLSSLPTALYEAGSYSIPEAYVITQVIEAVIASGGTVADVTTTTAASASSEYWTYVGDGSTTTYELIGITSSVTSDYQVSVDGVTQTPDTSYSISAINQSITFTEAPPATTIILVVKRY